MPKKLLKKLFPQLESKEAKKPDGFIGRMAQDPYLWHLNRKSVSRAFAIGVFAAFMPLPTQMLIAAVLAFVFRGNFPIALASTWISNPITMPPLYYSAYQFGAFLLGVELQPFNFEYSFDSLFTVLKDIWQPFLVGCVAMGALMGALAYASVLLFWRFYIIRVWQQRKLTRAK